MGSEGVAESVGSGDALGSGESSDGIGLRGGASVVAGGASTIGEDVALAIVGAGLGAGGVVLVGDDVGSAVGSRLTEGATTLGCSNGEAVIGDELAGMDALSLEGATRRASPTLDASARMSS